MRAELALPEKRAARRVFGRARFTAVAAVHDEIRGRLLERLELLRVAPRVAVDLGCGLGRGAHALAMRYPRARVLGVDWSFGALESARRELAATQPSPPIALAAGDAERLPLKSGAIDLVLASLVLPWSRPDALFAEAARVLGDGGLLLFATLGPDSLQEIRRAWAGVDDGVHVHAAFDMHDLGDLALRAGLADAVLDVDRIELTYTDLAALVADLRAAGAVNVAAGRRRGLTGRRRWQAFAARLGPGGGRIAVTLEVVLGQAWRVGPAAQASGAGGEVGIAVDRIGRRSRRDPGA